MRLRKVNSKALLAIGYDSMSHLLAVKFRISRKIYGFLDVPGKVYESLMQARSKGSFFNEHIKHRYQFIELK